MLFTWAITCAHIQTPTPSPAECPHLCDHMLIMNCPGAKTTPKGATCVEICTNVQNSGVISWDMQCRLTAATCAAMDECERGK